MSSIQFYPHADSSFNFLQSFLIIEKFQTIFKSIIPNSIHQLTKLSQCYSTHFFRGISRITESESSESKDGLIHNYQVSIKNSRRFLRTVICTMYLSFKVESLLLSPAVSRARLMKSNFGSIVVVPRIRDCN